MKDMCVATRKLRLYILATTFLLLTDFSIVSQFAKRQLTRLSPPFARLERKSSKFGTGSRKERARWVCLSVSFSICLHLPIFLCVCWSLYMCLSVCLSIEYSFNLNFTLHHLIHPNSNSHLIHPNSNRCLVFRDAFAFS